eukprot:TRINITY_DN6441_c0_g1_i5.p2 TRINITY_DN6441_c0_g1~~TRINITY_DN6441_c0_g1_i5.p2  ORF type:complete len:192 (-),score=33.79 TRINITY_DN6441_c0_g1_i5:151-726(-)
MSCTGGSNMNYEQFFECMFELADMWCDSINGHDYAEFLRGIFDEIHTACARGTGIVGAKGMWHAARNVLCAPRALYKAGGYDVTNFAAREELARNAVNDIMKKVDQFHTNGKITVTEMMAMLGHTSFGGFTQWMTRMGRKNWLRFDRDRDGRIDKEELYEALLGFLVSDGYGREFERLNATDHGYLSLIHI